MTVVPFDTLKLSRKLEAGGFTQDQAHAAAEALAEAMSGAELATRNDLKSEIQLVRDDLKSQTQLVRGDLRSEVQQVRDDLGGETQSIRTDLGAVKTDLQAVKVDLQTVKAELEAKIELSKRDITIRIGSMFVVAVGVMLAAMRFML